MRLLPSLVVLLLVSLVVPMRPAASTAEAHLPELVHDIVKGELCARMKGSFMPLSAGGSGDDEGGVTGRLWVRQCQVTTRGRALGVEVGGDGWRWVDRERSRLGAEFGVSEYVRFGYRIAMEVDPELSYSPQARVATLRLRPASDPEVSVEVRGHTDVETGGVWGDLLATSLSVVGSGLEERAEDSFSASASRRFEGRLSEGMSAALDLCTGQVFSTLGLLQTGDLPRPELSPAPEGWVASQELRLMAGGIDVAGPWGSDDAPVQARVQVSEGAVEVALTCAERARDVARGFVEEASPGALEGPTRRVAAGETVELTRNAEECPVALVTRNGAGDAMARALFLVWSGPPDPVLSCAGAASSRATSDDEEGGG